MNEAFRCISQAVIFTSIWKRVPDKQRGRLVLRHVQAVGLVSVLFVFLPSSTYLFTVGVEVVYFHLITLRHAPQSVGFLWTRDRPVAETST
jgi:small neutral amino acid transporter SnatA (MarC family)